MKTLILPLLLALTLQPAGYRADIEAFRQHRAEEIGGPTGWAALVGLHWLTPGEFVVGSDATSGIHLTGPSAPGRLATIGVGADSVHFRITAGLDATFQGRPAAEFDMTPGVAADNGLKVGGMTLVVIRRDTRLALRVWDTRAPNRVAFKGLHWMPIDAKWRISARWEPHPRTQPRMKIMNVLGETVLMQNPGAVVFAVGGKAYRMEALLESDDAKELFFIFKDETSNKTTYGAGRYLYTPLPKNGRVDLDFNKAKNPPCAFTDFATCPLPPAANRLALAVLAGELDYQH
ncbi:MAG: DUF1684 domain-containing protein [Acidobacteria bacterium]|nr:MAG: DUF1684 domain-containing protein [Acidobacteriota bacterium]